MAEDHFISEQDEYDYKYAQPSQQSNMIIEQDDDDTFHHQLFSDIVNDVDDPSISDMDTPKHSNNTNHHHRDRKKSKSSSNVLQQFNEMHKKKQSHPNEPYIRQRRHSESSSESHSNEYRKRNQHQKHKHKHKHKHNHKTSKSSNNNDDKLPILIPLNVNGKSKKASPPTIQQKKSNSNPQSPRSSRGKSFTRSILSKYKSVKNLQSKKKSNEEEQKGQGLGISGPLNVQHVIHVEWDDQRKAYKV